ncbi:MAG: hypothetical protein PGN08_14565 [Sphingomonas taxi]
MTLAFSVPARQVPASGCTSYSAAAAAAQLLGIGVGVGVGAGAGLGVGVAAGVGVGDGVGDAAGTTVTLPVPLSLPPPPQAVTPMASASAAPLFQLFMIVTSRSAPAARDDPWPFRINGWLRARLVSPDRGVAATNRRPTPSRSDADPWRPPPRWRVGR